MLPTPQNICYVVLIYPWCELGKYNNDDNDDKTLAHTSLHAKKPRKYWTHFFEIPTPYMHTHTGARVHWLPLNFIKVTA